MQASRDRGKTGTKKSQAHKNRTAYKLQYQDDKKNLKDKENLDRLCGRCYDTLRWKLDYGKYRALKTPAVCNHCSKKNVLKPYRNLCIYCADELKACSKCQFIGEYTDKCDIKISDAQSTRIQKEMDDHVKMMQERSRRRVQRELEKGEIQWKDGKFVLVEGGADVVGLYYQKKFWSILGIEAGEDYVDDLDF